MINYFSLSFNYADFYERVKIGKEKFQIGKYLFPVDIEKLDKEYREHPDSCLGVQSFILMRAEQIVKAAFMLNGYPAAHQYSWPDGSLYYDTRADKHFSGVIDSMESLIAPRGVHITLSESCMLTPEQLCGESHKSDFKTRYEYIDACAGRGYNF